MKKEYYQFILSILILSQSWMVFSQNREPACDTLFPPSCFYQADTGMMPLIMCPPLDTLGNIPDNFIGYNVYRDSELVAFLPYPAPPYIIEEGLLPGTYLYVLCAVYDLAPCGFPGETGESGCLITTCVIRFGYPLDFLEDWSSGSFETNNWIIDGENWTINAPFGNPSPSAEFTWDPVLTDYDISLESYPLLADSLYAGQIFLDFDITLDAYNSTGVEKMFIQTWNWANNEWITLDIYSNANGSFDWVPVHLNITEHAISQVFKIRFQATGFNSLDIISWFIDNIHVYRECEAPFNLDLEVIAPWEIFKLTWEYPESTNDQWIQWDDGVNYTSIGTIGPLEFDVAARWTPDQLENFPGAVLKQVAFYPAESISSYSIRVWTGEAAQNLVIDQLVEEPTIDTWNYIDLETPVPIDTSQELWIGYHMNSVFGYPAGVDDGPAFDGYGNMIYYFGWHTLLEMNPDLDYNFNIEAFIEFTDTNYFPQMFGIYRSDEGGPWFLRDSSQLNYYFDDSVCMTSGKLAFDYKVTALCIVGNDSCESDFSNEIMEVCEGIYEDKEQFILNIYPNPANDLFTIESSEMIGLISLYSYNGRLMFRKEIADRNYILPVKDYPEGMYLLSVETGSEVVSRKVVIMR